MSEWDEWVLADRVDRFTRDEGMERLMKLRRDDPATFASVAGQDPALGLRLGFYEEERRLALAAYVAEAQKAEAAPPAPPAPAGAGGDIGQGPRAVAGAQPVGSPHDLLAAAFSQDVADAQRPYARRSA